MTIFVAITNGDIFHARTYIYIYNKVSYQSINDAEFTIHVKEEHNRRSSIGITSANGTRTIFIRYEADEKIDVSLE